MGHTDPKGDLEKMKLTKNKTKPKKTKSKFHNVKTVIDGITFDSLIESRFYTYLKDQKKNGHVKSFDLQPEFILLDKYKHNGKIIQPIKYKADFRVIWNDGSEWIVDIKGGDNLTQEFRLKKKMFHHRYPLINLVLLTESKTKEWITVEEYKKTKKQKK